jgi:hypothetical protein
VKFTHRQSIHARLAAVFAGDPRSRTPAAAAVCGQGGQGGCDDAGYRISALLGEDDLDGEAVTVHLAEKIQTIQKFLGLS